ARTGPLYLKIPEIAALIAEAEAPKGEHYNLHAWVVMPNHVHLLITPLIDPSVVLRKLKGSTARRSNLILNLQGQTFWQAESYDRVVRNVEEFRLVEGDIIQNPVKAGLAANPEQYRW